MRCSSVRIKKKNVFYKIIVAKIIGYYQIIRRKNEDTILIIIVTDVVGYNWII